MLNKEILIITEQIQKISNSVEVLQKKNQQLLSIIEDMKCCGNCANQSGQCPYRDFTCNKDHENWILKEDKHNFKKILEAVS